MPERGRSPEPGADNLPGDPGRLFDVVEGDTWEGELRRSLADRAAGVRPSGVDVAGVAIARARKVRRRRTGLGLVAVAAGTLLATGVLLQGSQGGAGGSGYGAVSGLIDGSGSGPTTPAPDQSTRPPRDAAVAVDVSADLIGDADGGGLELVTGGGQAVDLGGISHVRSAHRVGDGWAVVSGADGTIRLSWVTGDGAPVVLLAGMDAIVVGRGQVAWQREAVLSAATLSTGGELAGRVRTSAPAGGGLPVGFVDRAVLLERAEPAGWDTWHPARGDYRPGWNQQVLRVYGSLPEGTVALGLVPPEPGAAGPCLARLDAARSLKPMRVSCVPGELPVTGPAAISPEGRWLLASSSRRPLLVDLAETFSVGSDNAVTELAGVPGTGTPVWLGPDRALFATGDRLVQLWPERAREGVAGALENVPLEGASPLVVELV